jgi:hypothetical protein
MAEYRYFEVSYHNYRHDLIHIDKAVWELRRYCQPLDYTIQTSTGLVNLLQPNLQRLRHEIAIESKETCIMNGWLEGVMRKKDHATREPLLWNNLFFGPSKRKKVKMVGFTESANAPLAMHPEVLDDVLRYIYLPKDVVAAFRAELASDGSQQ